MAENRTGQRHEASGSGPSPEMAGPDGVLSPGTLERIRRSWPVVRAGLAEGAKVTPGKPDVVGDFPFSYKLFEHCEMASDMLERFASAGLLDRDFFERVFLCPECFSSAVWFREVCGNCGGADLTRTELIHHYPCATVLPRDAFGPPDQMVCPKCRQALVDMGVDYVAQPAEFVCSGCGHHATTSLTAGRCSRCENKFMVPEALETDWFSYLSKQGSTQDSDTLNDPSAFRDAMLELVRLSEERDPAKGNHVERVSNFSRVLLNELAARGELKEPARDEIMATMEDAATLHDIGQIGVPDIVLVYPGRLREEHLALVRKHVPIGDKWLHVAQEQPGAEIRRAVHVVRGHHERWDGGGYPHGLKKDDIPIEARIVAVADVYDAMTSSRGYRGGLPPEEVEKRMEAQAGKHFDPVVIKAFFDSKRKIADVRESVSTANDEMEQELDFELEQDVEQELEHDFDEQSE